VCQKQKSAFPGWESTFEKFKVSDIGHWCPLPDTWPGKVAADYETVSFKKAKPAFCHSSFVGMTKAE